MKKILFLSPLPPPHYGSAMSSEMCLNILKNSGRFEIKNIKLNYSENMRDVGKINLKKIMGILKVSGQTIKEIKLLNPDIVYFVPATSGLGLIRDAYFIRQVKKLWKGKILFHIRSRISKRDWHNGIYRGLYKKMFSNQKAIVLDELLKEDLHGLIQDEDISVLSNAIRSEVSELRFEEIIRNRKNQNSFNLLFLSNMDETKGWLKLLEACKILKRRNINFKCNFVGAWPSKKEKRKFQKFAIKNNLQGDIKYLGKKIDKEKGKILEISDILIFPTEYKLETFGRVIIEAMMFGLPVIANGIAAIPTTIQHGETGFVLKDNSPEEITDYILKLKDKKFRERIGLKGRKRFLQRYEIRKYEKGFLKLFK